MIKDLLKSFYRMSARKPTRLIFYRDGVSEGQFAEVQRFEITQVSLPSNPLIISSIRPAHDSRGSVPCSIRNQIISSDMQPS